MTRYDFGDVVLKADTDGKQGARQRGCDNPWHRRQAGRVLPHLVHLSGT